MPFYRCKGVSTVQSRTYTTSTSNSTIHLYYDHNDDDDAEYYRPVVGGGVTVTLNGEPTATVSPFRVTRHDSYYISGGSPSYSLRGVRKSDGATVTIGSGSGSWAATTYNVEAYSSLTLSVNCGQARRYRWPAGTSYDIWCVWEGNMDITLNAPPPTVNTYFTYVGTCMGSGS